MRVPIASVNAEGIEDWEKGYEEQPQSKLSLKVRLGIAIIGICLIAGLGLLYSAYFAVAAMSWIGTGADQGSEPASISVGIFIFVVCLVVTAFLVIVTARLMFDWARKCQRIYDVG